MPQIFRRNTSNRVALRAPCLQAQYHKGVCTLFIHLCCAPSQAPGCSPQAVSGRARTWSGLREALDAPLGLSETSDNGAAAEAASVARRATEASGAQGCGR